MQKALYIQSLFYIGYSYYSKMITFVMIFYRKKVILEMSLVWFVLALVLNYRIVNGSSIHCFTYFVIHLSDLAIEFFEIESSFSHNYIIVSSHVFCWFPHQVVEKSIEHKYRELYICFGCWSSPWSTCYASYSCYSQSISSCFCCAYFWCDKYRIVRVEIDWIFWILLLKKSYPVFYLFCTSLSARSIDFISCIRIGVTIVGYRDWFDEVSTYIGTCYCWSSVFVL